LLLEYISAKNTEIMPSLPKTYKAAVLEKPNAPFVIQDRELKLPEAGQVLVKVSPAESASRTLM